MKTHHKIVVLGSKSVGKTSILCQLINGKIPTDIDSDEFTTIEDIYSACITDRGAREKVHFIDTAPMVTLNPDIIKTYVSYADGFVIVYAINDINSYQIMDQIKKCVDRCKDKREIPIIVLGNKMDKFRDRHVSHDESHSWIQRERTQLFEVTATERTTLLEPMRCLLVKMTPHPVNRKGKNTNIKLEL